MKPLTGLLALAFAALMLPAQGHARPAGGAGVGFQGHHHHHHHHYHGGGWWIGAWWPFYVVVDDPPPFVVQLPSAPLPPPPPDPVYEPRSGQSAAQTEADRQGCNRWATTQPDAMADAQVFQRSVASCMQGRGYGVR
jgi:hypothetical protein